MTSIESSRSHWESLKLTKSETTQREVRRNLKIVPVSMEKHELYTLWVDATFCNELTGGLPPVTPALTEILKLPSGSKELKGWGCLNICKFSVKAP